MDNLEENLAITICSTSVLSLVQSIHSPAIPFVLTGPHKDFTDGGPHKCTCISIAVPSTSTTMNITWDGKTPENKAYPVYLGVTLVISHNSLSRTRKLRPLV